MNSRRSLVQGVAALLLLVLAATPLAALDTPSDSPVTEAIEQALDEALDAVLDELVYAEMAELLGTPVAPRVERLAKTLEVDRLEPAVAEQRFRDIDDVTGPTALLALADADIAISPAVKRVLDPGTLDGTPAPRFAPYVTAYAELLGAREGLRGGSLDAAVDFADLLPVRSGLGPDFGAPPPQLAQVDDFVIGKELLEPTSSEGAGATPGSSFAGLGATELAIAAVAGTIVLGLIGLTVVARRRRDESRTDAPSEEDLVEAGRAVNACSSVSQLCAEVANQACKLGAEAAMTTIDGEEAHSGPPFEIAPDLVLRANREGRFVVNKTITAVPLIVSGRAIGLLAVNNGEGRIMEAFVPVIEQAHRSITKQRKIEEFAFVDGLTGIANRRRFDSDLESMMGLVSGESTPVAMAMFDVDNFKAFNDRNGHQAGDSVLRQVAGLIAGNLRTSDVVYRYGGEEFVALLPGATVDDAYIVIERIRLAVENASFDGETENQGGKVTISVGIAAAEADETVDLVRAADQALYEAKQAGRNRVVIEASL